MNGVGMGSIGFGFGEFSGMSSMGIGAGTGIMGMGPRASRQWQLGQLGRRASSTQPILQHQLASGAFNNLVQQPGQPFAQWSSAPFDFGLNQNRQQTGFDGFVGAVAEGFRNPFATSAPANNANESMWYDSVDPMTPVQSQAGAQYVQTSTGANLPPVDTGLLNSSFNFGTAQDVSGTSGSDSHMEAAQSPKSSVSTSAPQTAVQGRFGPLSSSGHGSNSAPGTGMRDSFDFSAFNAFLQQFPAQNQGQAQGQSQMQLQERQGYEGIPPNSMPSNAPGYPIAQPMPVRKVGLPCVPEASATAPIYHEQTYPETGSYQEQSVPQQQGHIYYQDQTQIANEHGQYPGSQQSSTESSADASPASGFIPMTSAHHQHQVHHAQHDQQHPEVDIVSGHELLDGPVDVNAMSSANAGIQQQQVGVPAEGTCDPNVNVNFNYDYNGMTQLEAQNMYSMHGGLGGDMAAGYGTYTHAGHAQEGAHNGSNNHTSDPRFSFSDFVHGSPFVTSASAVGN